MCNPASKPSHLLQRGKQNLKQIIRESILNFLSPIVTLLSPPTLFDWILVFCPFIGPLPKGNYCFFEWRPACRDISRTHSRGANEWDENHVTSVMGFFLEKDVLTAYPWRITGDSSFKKWDCHQISSTVFMVWESEQTWAILFYHHLHFIHYSSLSKIRDSCTYSTSGQER